MKIIPLLQDCRSCGNTKAFTEFDRRSKSGRISLDCKVCRREARRAYYRNNSEKIKANAADYRRRNPGKASISAARWQGKNPEKVKGYRAKIHEYIKAYGRNRYANDPEWREHVKKSSREWRIANPEQRMLQHQRRRARASTGHFSAPEWRALKDWFGNKCLSCGGTGKLTPDHVVPLSIGGPNTIGNIQPLCFRCNSSKQAKHIDYRDPERLREFLAQL